MLFEELKSFLEGLQRLPGPRGVLAFLFYFLDEFAVAGDVGLAFGNIPIGLNQVLAFSVHRRRPLPQSSSASLRTAGAFAFFILSQSGERPER